MDYGILTGFDGLPVNHSREIPYIGKRGYQRRYLDDLLPIDGEMAGMELIAIIPASNPDPVCLYNRWGKIVKQWPEGYIPDHEEVREAVMVALKDEGRRII